MISASASTATFEDLVNDLDTFLSTYGETRGKVTSLTAPLGATDLIMEVDDPSMLDKGYVEVGDELMWVQSIDKGSATATLMPWGRAQLSSDATHHSAGTRVNSNPRFPRFRMKQELNNQINALYPDLFAVLMDETNTYRPAVVTYPLPVNCESILSISYKKIGPSKQWEPVTRYRFDTTADLTVFPTGNSVDIYQGLVPGRTIKIIYRGRPVPFTDSQGSDLLSDHGISDSWRDILQLGAAARCLMSADSARLDLGTIESANRANLVQPTMAQNVAKSWLQQQQFRVQQKKRQLLLRYQTSQVRYT